MGFRRSAPVIAQFYIPGAYYGPQGTINPGGGAVIADTLLALPWIVSRPLTIDRISVNHYATVATAGSVLRLGIWRLVSATSAILVLDAGTVALDTAAARKEIVVNKTLSPDLYLIGAAAQTFAGTANVARNTTGDSINEEAVLRGQAANFSVQSSGLSKAGISGAFTDLVLARADWETLNDITYVWVRSV